MPFYIELPADQYGNCALPYAVIEGEMVSNGHYDELDMKAPPELLPYNRYHWTFAEVPDGPARLLTRDEWKALVTETTGYDFNR